MYKLEKGNIAAFPPPISCVIGCLITGKTKIETSPKVLWDTRQCAKVNYKCLVCCLGENK